jgi:hypothetical protein
MQCNKASLFDHLVGARERRWQYSKVEQDPGGLRCAKSR